MQLPAWLKPIGTAVAVMLAGFLIAGLLWVLYASTKPPDGYHQSRLTWQTKNTTRLDGADAGQVATSVSQAIYPSGGPDAVILHAPDDWRAGLLATSLLKPLNAILLPAAGDAQAEITRLSLKGTRAFGGARVIAIGDAQAPAGARRVTVDELTTLRLQLGRPAHAIVVNRERPETALLAAPWAAYSGDLVTFQAAQVPSGIPTYALGDAEAPDDVTRIGGGSPEQVAVAFASFDDGSRLFGWGMNADTLAGYRGYTLARPDQPSIALQSANIAAFGRPGPLLWSGEFFLPQVVNDYLFSQRAAFFVSPLEGPFHHAYVLGGLGQISFPAQAQADYAVEIGPYLGKGVGMSGLDMLAAAWVMLGVASSLWVVVHGAKFLPQQMWIMRLAWPLFALMAGPFGIPLYWLAYSAPTMEHNEMIMWDRPVWLQGMVATIGSVGFGGALMVATGLAMTTLGVPLIANNTPVFWLGTPMVIIMLTAYVVAVLVSWPLYQAPMLAMFHGWGYKKALPKSLPIVLLSMASVSLAMYPGMWWFMMMRFPMMPTEEFILWFGTMFFTVFLGFLIAWGINFLLIRRQLKPGLM